MTVAFIVLALYVIVGICLAWSIVRAPDEEDL